MMLTVLAVAATQTPTPSDPAAPDPKLVTPGTVGFVFTLIIVIAGILLARDAMRRVRRVRARAGVETTYSIPMRGADAVPNQSALEVAGTDTAGADSSGEAVPQDEADPGAPEAEPGEVGSEESEPAGPGEAEPGRGTAAEPAEPGEAGAEESGEPGSEQPGSDTYPGPASDAK